MEFHPIADEWPLMEGAEFSSLVASVAKYGVRVPCWKFEDKILDGRNRCRAAEVAGVPVLGWHEFKGTNVEARELAKLLNDERRHLTREDRAAWVYKLRARGLSTRAIADAVGVDAATVRRDLKSGGAIAPPASTEGGGDGCRNREGSKGTDRPDHKGDREASGAGSGTCGIEARISADVPSDSGTPQREAGRVTGLDGKKYPAKRPEVKSASKPAKVKEDRENVRTAYLLRADAAIQFAKLAYSGKVTQEIVDAARRVASAWADLVKSLEASL